MTTELFGFSTRAIHAGQEPDPATGAVVPPLYLTSTFALEELGKDKGYMYARVSNPTRKALETSLASLESGCAGLAFASGVAAIHAVLSLLSSGDHVIAQDRLYGGTVRLFNSVLKRFGIEFTYTNDFEKALRPATKMLYLETPTNPLMELIDLKKASEWAHSHGLRVVVDNTFMTPYFQRPLELGADIVVHSTTKYLNGHSDGIGGAAVFRHPEDADRAGFIQKAAGAVLSPMDSWLVSRGIKTLPVRMREHEKNAMEVARWLAGHKKIRRVYYPGLPDHPGHELARRQMSGFGGMVSFDLESLDAAKRFFKEVKLWLLAESLGGVESLVAHPPTMSHAGLTPEERAHMGIGDGLVRLSVGLEDVEDLKADLDRALQVV